MRIALRGGVGAFYYWNYKPRPQTGISPQRLADKPTIVLVCLCCLGLCFL